MGYIHVIGSKKKAVPDDKFKYLLFKTVFKTNCYLIENTTACPGQIAHKSLYKKVTVTVYVTVQYRGVVGMGGGGGGTGRHGPPNNKREKNKRGKKKRKKKKKGVN